jgi:hypothetical protein
MVPKGQQQIRIMLPTRTGAKWYLMAFKRPVIESNLHLKACSGSGLFDTVLVPVS